MNYLTNYYKNLCEQLQNKINFLEKSLNENLNVELNKLEYAEPLNDSDTGVRQTPPPQQAPRAPKIVKPTLPPNATPEQYEEYLKKLKAWERYNKECGSGTGNCGDNIWIYPNPPHPADPKGPKWKEGDFYIDGNGVMYRREAGKWVKV